MGLLARFDKAFLFVTFSFLTNFAPKNFITSKNVSMNKKLKSVLLMLFLIALGSVDVVNAKEYNSIAEMKQNAVVGDYVYCQLDMFICAAYTGSFAVFTDNTSSIIVKGNFYWESGLQSSNRYLNGYICGYITMWGGSKIIEKCSFWGEHDSSEFTGNFVLKKITEEEYWNYEGYAVEIECKDMLCWHEEGSFPDIPYELTVYNKARIKGVVNPTADGKKRLLLLEEWPIITTIYSDEDENNYTLYSPQQGVVLKRHLEANKWHSFCLPFVFYPGNKYDVAEFVSDENGILSFQKATYINAGKPYLIKPKMDIDSLVAEVWGLVAEPTVKEGINYNFVGALNTIQPKEGSYYLSANNTIKPLASGGTIKSFRAYFEPNTPNAAQARAISIDGEITAIENIDFGDDILGQPKKIYNLNGQYVGDNLDALPKGVYLVNGKKVTK